MRNLLVLLGAVLLSGCYTYVPAEVGAPPRGAAVRAHLDPAVTVPVGEIAVQQTVRVEGEVVSWDPDQLVLSASTLYSTSGQDFLGGGRTVHLPRTALAQLEARHLSTWRTALLTGGLIAGAVVLGVIAQEGFGGGEGGNGGGGQPQ